MDFDEISNFQTFGSNSYSGNNRPEVRNDESSENDENKLTSCTGEISEHQLKSIQEELDRAKESYNDSFSSKSSCVIC